jgi:hypothetical protein
MLSLFLVATNCELAIYDITTGAHPQPERLSGVAIAVGKILEISFRKQRWAI